MADLALILPFLISIVVAIAETFIELVMGELVNSFLTALQHNVGYLLPYR